MRPYCIPTHCPFCSQLLSWDRENISLSCQNCVTETFQGYDDDDKPDVLRRSHFEITYYDVDSLLYIDVVVGPFYVMIDLYPTCRFCIADNQTNLDLLKLEGDIPWLDLESAEQLRKKIKFLLTFS